MVALHLTRYRLWRRTIRRVLRCKVCRTFSNRPSLRWALASHRGRPSRFGSRIPKARPALQVKSQFLPIPFVPRVTPKVQLPMTRQARQVLSIQLGRHGPHLTLQTPEFPKPRRSIALRLKMALLIRMWPTNKVETPALTQLPAPPRLPIHRVET